MARRTRRHSCPKGARYLVHKKGRATKCAKTKASAIRMRKAMGKGARVTKR